jgi:hypothetical protein
VVWGAADANLMVVLTAVLAFCVGWGLCAAHAAAREAAGARADPHVYLSSACYHEAHASCPRLCGFCARGCTCACHRGQDPT